MPDERLPTGIDLCCLPELSNSSECTMSLPVMSVSNRVYVPGVVRLPVIFTASLLYQDVNGFLADANKSLLSDVARNAVVVLILSRNQVLPEVPLGDV